MSLRLSPCTYCTAKADMPIGKCAHSSTSQSKHSGRRLPCGARSGSKLNLPSGSRQINTEVDAAGDVASCFYSYKAGLHWTAREACGITCCLPQLARWHPAFKKSAAETTFAYPKLNAAINAACTCNAGTLTPLNSSACVAQASWITVVL